VDAERYPATAAHKEKGDWNPLWDQMHALDADFLEAYLAFRSVPHESGPLDTKTRELIMIAITRRRHIYMSQVYVATCRTRSKPVRPRPRFWKPSSSQPSWVSTRAIWLCPFSSRKPRSTPTGDHARTGSWRTLSTLPRGTQRVACTRAGRLSMRWVAG